MLLIRTHIAEPSEGELKALRAAVKNPSKAGVIAQKEKALKKVQPSRQSGAPKIARPTCKFSREEVKIFQDLFIEISGDGAIPSIFRNYF
eukprot:COSAG05_NODE_317_length_11545_cov_73.981391_18_plen_90_part_00